MHHDTIVDKEDLSESSFPSDGEDGDDDTSNAIPWRAVDITTWLKVIETRSINTKNGKAMIITFQKRDRSIVRVCKVIRPCLRKVLVNVTLQRVKTVIVILNLYVNKF